MFKKIVLWWHVIRPYSLFASTCPVLTGLLVGGITSWTIALLTLLCAICLQVLSNLINDYYDFVRGTDDEGRTGSERVLATGRVDIHQMRYAIGVVVSLCFLLGIYLVWVGGWVILLIGALSILCAWLYTGSEHSLSYMGVGDIFVLLFYGIIACWGTSYLQGTHSISTLYAGTVNGLISMCLLIINNLRDIATDAAHDKRTFPVRFGKRAGEIGMLIVILAQPLFTYLTFGRWNLAMLVVIPMLVIWFQVLHAHEAGYNKYLLWPGFINVFYVILVAITLFV